MIPRNWENAPKQLHAQSIDEVIASLDRIVGWAIINRHRAGFFAALYRKVTINVRDGIINGDFEDGARMEKLDVIFANRYLDAFEAYAHGETVSRVWKLAFELSADWSPLVLMHLMIGMNAHINFDLGIAAADTVEPDQLAQLKPDFEKINDVLASLVDEVETELGEIWPLFGWLDRLAGTLDEQLADSGMTFARDRAWAFAERVAASDDRDRTLREEDETMTLIGELFLAPGLYKSGLLLLLRFGERGSVADKIHILE